MYVIEERNVNGAYDHLALLLLHPESWRKIAPRGKPTWELKEPVATVYSHPVERVLLDPERDANPFFHLMEAVWIAAGRRDVGFLKQFLPSITDYSDDGRVFNAAYGFRLRKHYGVDQLLSVVELLRRERTSRRAYCILGDPHDVMRITKDVACNVTLFFKLRDQQLHMTVCNRSNDAVWGAYGANAVQFSFLQELVAAGIHAQVGTYTQVSDSFHVYPDNSKVMSLLARPRKIPDPYAAGLINTHPLVGPGTTLNAWLEEAEDWVQHFPDAAGFDPFFRDVLNPMGRAFMKHRYDKDTLGALAMLEYSYAYAAQIDWVVAGHAWLARRLKGAT